LRKYRYAAVSGKCSRSYLSGDIKTALREWNPLAKGGNAAAQLIWVRYTRRKKAFQKNHTTSVKWYTGAAGEENSVAKANLGTIV
tara:strand:+ start:36 stop:290 length:255 start_codon:yes stop_codon:yes gene_type:complete